MGSLLLTLMVAAPVVYSPSSRLFGTEVVGRHHDPFTFMEQLQKPLVVGPYLQPMTDLPGRALALATGPVVALNVLVLLTFPLSAITAYLLAFHLTRAPIASALAGLLYAFSPFHLAHSAYHPHIAQTQWLPLYLLSLWLSVERPTAARLFLLWLSLIGLCLSSFYSVLIAGVMSPVALIAYWWISPNQPTCRKTGYLLLTTLSLILAAFLGWLAIRQFIPDVLTHPSRFAFPRSDLFEFSARWWSYLVPPIENPVAGSWARSFWERYGIGAGLLEQQVSLGWSVLALAAYPLWRWLRGDRNSAAVRSVPILVVLAVAGVVCSLSPERTIGSITFTRPSAYLYELAPMFRAYARFGMVVSLMVILLAGVGVTLLSKTRPRLLPVFLLIMASVEYAPFPPWRWRDVLPTPAHRWVANLPSSPKLFDCATGNLLPERSIPWLLGHPVSFLNRAVPDCGEPNLAGKLAVLGHTHLLIRAESPEGRWMKQRPAPEGLRLDREFEDASIFSVVAEKPPLIISEISGFHSREYGGSRTWRWMGHRGDWEITNTTTAVIEADVEVELEAFPGPRQIELQLNEVPVQLLTVPVERATHRIGPLILQAGENRLTFLLRAPAVVAGEILGNEDPRAISIALGNWCWNLIDLPSLRFEQPR